MKKNSNNTGNNPCTTENNQNIGYRDFISSYETRKALVNSLTLMDDAFFAAVMEDEKVCTFVLREITEIKTLTVKSCKAQYHLKNMISHSVILDVIAEDADGRVYNIEVQKSNKDHHPKRIRYYQANVDTAFLEKGCDYELLPEAWFIFISDFDPFGLNDNYYEIERKIQGRNEIVSNGVHEIYLNTKIVNNRKITKLLQYFKNSDPEATDFGELSDKVRYFKKNRKGDKVMCDKIQRLIDEANEEKEKMIQMQASTISQQNSTISEQAAEIARLKAQLAATNN